MATKAKVLTAEAPAKVPTTAKAPTTKASTAIARTKKAAQVGASVVTAMVVVAVHSFSLRAAARCGA